MATLRRCVDGFASLQPRCPGPCYARGRAPPPMHKCPRCGPGGGPGAEGLSYFLLRRWWRVLRSSLRCFFFAIRLRRFLMTEPTGPHSAGGMPPRARLRSIPRSAYRAALTCPDGGEPPPGGRTAIRSRTPSGGVDVGVPQVVVHGLLRHPERAAHPDRRELAGVHQPVHRHLGHAHHRGDLGHREEAHIELSRHALCPFANPAPASVSRGEPAAGAT